MLAFLPIYAIAALLATARPGPNSNKAYSPGTCSIWIAPYYLLGLAHRCFGKYRRLSHFRATVHFPAFLGMGGILSNRLLYLLFAPINAFLVGLLHSNASLCCWRLSWIVVLCHRCQCPLWSPGGCMAGSRYRTGAQPVPVYNFSDLQQTRFLYVGSAGYCIGAAAVLYNVVISIRHRLTKRMAIGGIALVLAACIVGSWSNLRSWQAATNYDLAINQRLLNLIPAQPRPRGTAWYIQDLPDNYRGAYLFRLGLGAMQRFTRSLDQTVGTVAIPSDATTEQVEQFLRNDTRDSYRLRFKYDGTTTNTMLMMSLA